MKAKLGSLRNKDVIRYAVECGLLDFSVNYSNPIRYEYEDENEDRLKVFIDDVAVGSVYIQIKAGF
jgi:hypothetical protein